MKIGIIGTGYVGSAAAFTLATQGIARDIVLVDTDKNRAYTEALDISHALPFFLPCRVAAGDYPDLEAADIIIITAGANQLAGESRIALLERNREVFRGIIRNIITYAADSLVLVTTNPVDIMTEITLRETGLPPSRVIGSGTLLDTARFRTILGEHLNIAPASVHAFVIGEHGDSEVPVWSAAGAGGMPLDIFAEKQNIPLTAEIKNHIDSEVRNAAYKIIAGKKATYYGIAGSLARICRAVAHNENCILTVSCHHENIEGIKNISLSLPAVINRSGVQYPLYPRLSSGERLLLKQSAEKIRSYLEDTGA